MIDILGMAPAGRYGLSRLRLGVIFSLLLLIVGFVSIVWTPYPTSTGDLGAALLDPGAAHWFGTDQMGRDLLSLAMRGVLTSFIVAALAVFLGAVIGVPLGVAAARWPGLIERIVLGHNGFLVAFPALVLAVLLAAAFGPSTLGVIVAVGLCSAPAFARATCGGLLVIGQLHFVAAARLAGTGLVETVRRHIVPTLAPVLLAEAVAQLSSGVLAEAALSFVGLGAQPPGSSLGLLLHDAQAYALSKPLPMVMVGLVLLLVVLSLNLVAGGIRELTDPKLVQGLDDGAA